MIRKYPQLVFVQKSKKFSRWHSDVVQKNNRPTFFITIARIKENTPKKLSNTAPKQKVICYFCNFEQLVVDSSSYLQTLISLVQQ